MNNLLKKLAVVIALGLGAMALGVSAKPAPRPAPRPAAHDWTTAISYLPSGAIVRGNPAAKVKLVEFISYTCPHCAHFNAEASPVLAASYVKTGKVQVEVRPFFRNMFDVTASLLAHCGPADRFLGNHDAILAGQETWMAPAQNPTSEQITRWSDSDFAKRMKNVADDLGLTALMEKRGYSAEQLNACLADKPLAQKMADMTEHATTAYKVTGTPSFLINDKLQADAYSWQALRPAIDKTLR